MPFNLQIIRTSDFIRLNGRGEYDQEETRRALSDIAKACIQSDIDCALLDIRNARSDMQMHDLDELALAFKEMGFRKNHRLAILHRSSAGERVEFFTLSSSERAEFFAMCASENGWNVQAFEDFELALEWLGAALPVEK
jgi:hypothetical protein